MKASVSWPGLKFAVIEIELEASVVLSTSVTVTLGSIAITVSSFDEVIPFEVVTTGG